MMLDDNILQAVKEGKRITMKSFLLREQGEEKLEVIVTKMFDHLGKSDYFGPVYAAIRELVQNSSKANLKRILFNEMNLNPLDEIDYSKGMEVFRRSIVESKISSYRKRIRDNDLFFTVSMECRPEVFIASVKNRFPLFPAEEIRIRDKFSHAKNIDNLYDFYMNYGDIAEGAGMGIAMVEILLGQAGIDRHNFTIFTDPVKNETVARVIVPFSPEYISPRQRFEIEREKRGLDHDAMRTLVRCGQVALPLY